ncbi:threonine--tRNA ligase [Clostridium botulinum]|uniref:Threonine--tRNA ligase n=1 Tax=Clostridium botulinum (strain Langeland / NCTC 10281 / Type F) TaxID=441772 RepID=SYT_CLOBL|nr:threonine--tRNA ligase [Clostridium botulinum]A7GI05.1 RecName: Full=Threonine--tRNA ligase; AltName: Full=Threonyl-tRNA synthetase; Short=ThrRS [Clostridium botulinum F str. Langeland]ABS39452.1 threonine--tRNA ligase [Clostridium botulinum F str. Langeland]ADG00783.1 threonine--tRNA ligase [Clostridium botulinum F str. 230613]KKM40712.1 threonyl-tRNA synthetase [Clostridium botulinum]MBY6794312.1 threonine--tRNA ligase [Clostridium botulinum]MBY6938100.1 threonine--tRNA ligase [Clostridi
MIKITLKDGKVMEIEEGIKISDIAMKISPALYKKALAAKIDGETVDLMTELHKDSSLEILTFEDEMGKWALRHTGAHILAQAVKRLYPEVKLAIGPAIDTGFYYDFEADFTFTPEMLEKIEAEIKKIIKENHKLERFELPREEAINLMKEKNEDYKVELIEDLPEGEVISFYKQGDFTDLCAGPHVPSTGKVKSVKLLSLAGAYWRGDEKNKMLQRIYGTAFTKKSELDEYLNMIEEAKKRDHRKLGKELDLFSIHEEGPGFPFFHPKGMIVRNILESFWREKHTKAGYQEIRTPLILNEALWHQSGHWDHYKENMYFTNIDDGDYAIKPMNCPGGILVYKSSMHSYRDLPLRLSELGIVHRHELSGALHGLMRVRCFTQDDAHLYMTKEQIKEEVIGIIKLIDEFYKLFGFEYFVELSTRPEDSMGSDEDWEIATNGLREALDSIGKEYRVNEGDGAFYGPKIDFHLKDCIGRTWQCGTIQLDFQMPERFDLSYIGADGEKHRPVMVHRTIYGSVERFIGILIEQYAGAFPTWLAPVQVKLMNITDSQYDYLKKVEETLKENNIRVEIDTRNEKIGYKIREAQLQKVPYMLILGDKEVEAGKVAVRSRKDGDLGAISLEEFIEKIKNEIKNKTN